MAHIAAPRSIRSRTARIWPYQNVMVPEAGLEPARVSSTVFETVASANSATRACAPASQRKLYQRTSRRQAGRRRLVPRLPPGRRPKVGRRSGGVRRRVHFSPRRKSALPSAPPEPIVHPNPANLEKCTGWRVHYSMSLALCTRPRTEGAHCAPKTPPSRCCAPRFWCTTRTPSRSALEPGCTTRDSC